LYALLVNDQPQVSLQGNFQAPIAVKLIGSSMYFLDSLNDIEIGVDGILSAGEKSIISTPGNTSYGA
jgi:hypothetical protein